MKLKEVVINGFELKDKKLLKKCYDEVLHKDKYWHFFFEVNHAVIRCKKSSSIKIQKILSGFKTEIRDYEENVEITKKYFKHFLKIFHLYSVLALSVPEVDINNDDAKKIALQLSFCLVDQLATDHLANYHPNQGANWMARFLADLVIINSYNMGRASNLTNLRRKNEIQKDE